MRAYKQRSGAVLAMVLFAAAAAAPVAPKGCAGLKGCNDKAKSTSIKSSDEVKDKSEDKVEDKTEEKSESPEALPEPEQESVETPSGPEQEDQPEIASASSGEEPALTQEPPTVLAEMPAALPNPVAARQIASLPATKPASARPTVPRQAARPSVSRPSVARQTARPVPVPRPAPPASKPASPRPAPSGPLRIASAQEITPAQAEAILKQTGYWKPGWNMTQALTAMETGYNEGAPTRGTLDATTREHLFREYQLYSAARRYYAAYPEISARATPQLFDKWIGEAAAQMTSIPAAQRVALLRAAIMQESRQVHWVDFRPTMSDQGAIGFGQALASKGRSFGYNPYDPGRNILLMARALDTAYRTEGSIYNSLGRYNGGPGWRAKGESVAYARNITLMMARNQAGT